MTSSQRRSHPYPSTVSSRLGYTLLLGGPALPVRESGPKWVPIYHAPPHASMNSKYIAGSPLIRLSAANSHHYLVSFGRPKFSRGLLGPPHEWYDTEQEASGAG